MQDSDSSHVQYTHTVKARIIHVTICADRMLTASHLDTEGDYRTGYRNVSYSQEQSYSGLRSPGRSCSTYL